MRASHFTVQAEALVAAMATEKLPCCLETWFRVMRDNDARNDDTRSPVGWWVDSPTRFASETRLGGPEAVLTAAFAGVSTPSSNIGPSLIWKKSNKGITVNATATRSRKARSHLGEYDAPADRSVLS